MLRYRDTSWWFSAVYCFTLMLKIFVCYFSRSKHLFKPSFVVFDLKNFLQSCSQYNYGWSLSKKYESMLISNFLLSAHIFKIKNEAETKWSKKFKKVYHIHRIAWNILFVSRNLLAQLRQKYPFEIRINRIYQWMTWIFEVEKYFSFLLYFFFSCQTFFTL